MKDQKEKQYRFIYFIFTRGAINSEHGCVYCLWHMVKVYWQMYTQAFMVS